MSKMMRIVSESLCLALVAALLAGGAFAASHDDQSTAMVSALIGSNPGEMAGGVASAPKPWVVSKGLVTVGDDGSVNLHVEGLLLHTNDASNGTTGPVTTVGASLVCGGTGGTVVGSTATVPLSSEGKAHIKDKITLTAPCPGPVVLVRAGGTGPFIALTGFNNSPSPGKSGDDQDSDH